MRYPARFQLLVAANLCPGTPVIHVAVISCAVCRALVVGVTVYEPHVGKIDRGDLLV